MTPSKRGQGDRRVQEVHVRQVAARLDQRRRRRPKAEGVWNQDVKVRVREEEESPEGCTAEDIPPNERIAEPAAQQASPRDEEPRMYPAGIGLDGEVQTPGDGGIGQRLSQSDDQKEPLLRRRRDVVSAENPHGEPEQKDYGGEAKRAAPVSPSAQP